MLQTMKKVDQSRSKCSGTEREVQESNSISNKDINSIKTKAKLKKTQT